MTTASPPCRPAPVTVEFYLREPAIAGGHFLDPGASLFLVSGLYFKVAVIVKIHSGFMRRRLRLARNFAGSKYEPGLSSTLREPWQEAEAVGYHDAATFEVKARSELL